MIWFKSFSWFCFSLIVVLSVHADERGAPATGALLQRAAVPETDRPDDTRFEQALIEIVSLEEDARFLDALEMCWGALHRFKDTAQQEILGRIRDRLRREKRAELELAAAIKGLAGEQEQALAAAREKLRQGGGGGRILLRKAVREGSGKTVERAAALLVAIGDKSVPDILVERMTPKPSSPEAAALMKMLPELKGSLHYGLVAQLCELSKGGLADRLCLVDVVIGALEESAAPAWAPGVAPGRQGKPALESLSARMTADEQLAAAQFLIEFVEQQAVPRPKESPRTQEEKALMSRAESLLLESRFPEVPLLLLTELNTKHRTGPVADRLMALYAGGMGPPDDAVLTGLCTYAAGKGVNQTAAVGLLMDALENLVTAPVDKGQPGARRSAPALAKLAVMLDRKLQLAVVDCLVSLVEELSAPRAETAPPPTADETAALDRATKILVQSGLPQVPGALVSKLTAAKAGAYADTLVSMLGRITHRLGEAELNQLALHAAGGSAHQAAETGFLMAALERAASELPAPDGAAAAGPFHFEALPARLGPGLQSSAVNALIAFIEKQSATAAPEELQRAERILVESDLRQVPGLLVTKLTAAPAGPTSDRLAGMLGAVVGNLSTDEMKRLAEHVTVGGTHQFRAVVLLMDAVENAATPLPPPGEVGRRGAPALDKLPALLPMDLQPGIVNALIAFVERQATPRAAGAPAQTQEEKAADARARKILVEGRLPRVPELLVAKLKAARTHARSAPFVTLLARMPDRVTELDAATQAALIAKLTSYVEGRVAQDATAEQKALADRAEDLLAASRMPQGPSLLASRLARVQGGPAVETLAKLLAETIGRADADTIKTLAECVATGQANQSAAAALLVNALERLAGAVVNPDGVARPPELETLPHRLDRELQSQVAVALVAFLEKQASPPPADAPKQTQQEAATVEKTRQILLESGLDQVPAVLASRLASKPARPASEVLVELLGRMAGRLSELDPASQTALSEALIVLLQGPAGEVPTGQAAAVWARKILADPRLPGAQAVLVAKLAEKPSALSLEPLVLLLGRIDRLARLDGSSQTALTGALAGFMEKRVGADATAEQKAAVEQAGALLVELPLPQVPGLLATRLAATSNTAYAERLAEILRQLTARTDAATITVLLGHAAGGGANQTPALSLAMDWLERSVTTPDLGADWERLPSRLDEDLQRAVATALIAYVQKQAAPRPEGSPQQTEAEKATVERAEEILAASGLRQLPELLVAGLKKSATGPLVSVQIDMLAKLTPFLAGLEQELQPVLIESLLSFMTHQAVPRPEGTPPRTAAEKAADRACGIILQESGLPEVPAALVGRLTKSPAGPLAERFAKLLGQMTDRLGTSELRQLAAHAASGGANQTAALSLVMDALEQSVAPLVGEPELEKLPTRLDVDLQSEVVPALVAFVEKQATPPPADAPPRTETEKAELVRAEAILVRGGLLRAPHLLATRLTATVTGPRADRLVGLLGRMPDRMVELDKESQTALVETLVAFMDLRTAARPSAGQQAAVATAEKILLDSKLPVTPRLLSDKLVLHPPVPSAARLASLLDQMTEQMDSAVIHALATHVAQGGSNQIAAAGLVIDWLENAATLAPTASAPNRAGLLALETLRSRLDQDLQAAVVKGLVAFIGTQSAPRQEREKTAAVTRAGRILAVGRLAEAPAVLAAALAKAPATPAAESLVWLLAEMKDRLAELDTTSQQALAQALIAYMEELAVLEQTPARMASIQRAENLLADGAMSAAPALLAAKLTKTANVQLKQRLVDALEAQTGHVEAATVEQLADYVAAGGTNQAAAVNLLMAALESRVTVLPGGEPELRRLPSVLSADLRPAVANALVAFVARQATPRPAGAPSRTEDEQTAVERARRILVESGLPETKAVLAARLSGSEPAGQWLVPLLSRLADRLSAAELQQLASHATQGGTNQVGAASILMDWLASRVTDTPGGEPALAGLNLRVDPALQSLSVDALIALVANQSSAPAPGVPEQLREEAVERATRILAESGLAGTQAALAGRLTGQPAEDWLVALLTRMAGSLNPASLKALAEHATQGGKNQTAAASILMLALEAAVTAPPPAGQNQEPVPEWEKLPAHLNEALQPLVADALVAFVVKQSKPLPQGAPPQTEAEQAAVQRARKILVRGRLPRVPQLLAGLLAQDPGGPGAVSLIAMLEEMKNRVAELDAASRKALIAGLIASIEKHAAPQSTAEEQATIDSCGSIMRGGALPRAPGLLVARLTELPAGASARQIAGLCAQMTDRLDREALAALSSYVAANGTNQVAAVTLLMDSLESSVTTSQDGTPALHNLSARLGRERQVMAADALIAFLANQAEPRPGGTPQTGEGRAAADRAVRILVGSRLPRSGDALLARLTGNPGAPAPGWLMDLLGRMRDSLGADNLGGLADHVAKKSANQTEAAELLMDALEGLVTPPPLAAAPDRKMLPELERLPARLDSKPRAAAVRALVAFVQKQAAPRAANTPPQTQAEKVAVARAGNILVTSRLPGTEALLAAALAKDTATPVADSLVRILEGLKDRLGELDSAAQYALIQALIAFMEPRAAPGATTEQTVAVDWASGILVKGGLPQAPGLLAATLGQVEAGPFADRLVKLLEQMAGRLSETDFKTLAGYAAGDSAHGTAAANLVMDAMESLVAGPTAGKPELEKLPARLPETLTPVAANALVVFLEKQAAARAKKVPQGTSESAAVERAEKILVRGRLPQLSPLLLSKLGQNPPSPFEEDCVRLLGQMDDRLCELPVSSRQIFFRHLTGFIAARIGPRATAQQKESVALAGKALLGSRLPELPAFLVNTLKQDPAAPIATELAKLVEQMPARVGALDATSQATLCGALIAFMETREGHAATEQTVAAERVSRFLASGTLPQAPRLLVARLAGNPPRPFAKRLVDLLTRLARRVDGESYSRLTAMAVAEGPNKARIEKLVTALPKPVQ